MNRFCSVLLASSVVLGWSAMAQGRVSTSLGPGTPQKGQAAQEKQGQTGRQATPATPASQVAQQEALALQAIQNELDPDKSIQLINDFEKKFPSSQNLGFAYFKGALVYQQKGDLQHSVEFGEKSLKAQGDFPAALVLVASMLPEPQSLKGNELDKEKKLTEAEEYSNRALQLIEKTPKQPNLTDEQFQQNKALLSGMAHSALGLVHLQRAFMALAGVDHGELAKAEQEYQSAVTLSPRPDPAHYFRLGQAYEQDNKIQEAIDAFSKASELSEGTELKKMADEQAEKLKKAKSEAKPSAKP